MQSSIDQFNSAPLAAENETGTHAYDSKLAGCCSMRRIVAAVGMAVCICLMGNFHSIQALLPEELK